MDIGGNPKVIAQRSVGVHRGSFASIPGRAERHPAKRKAHSGVVIFVLFVVSCPDASPVNPRMQNNQRTSPRTRFERTPEQRSWFTRQRRGRRRNPAIIIPRPVKRAPIGTAKQPAPVANTTDNKEKSTPATTRRTPTIAIWSCEVDSATRSRSLAALVNAFTTARGAPHTRQPPSGGIAFSTHFV